LQQYAPKVPSYPQFKGKCDCAERQSTRDGVWQPCRPTRVVYRIERILGPLGHPLSSKAAVLSFLFLFLFRPRRRLYIFAVLFFLLFFQKLPSELYTQRQCYFSFWFLYLELKLTENISVAVTDIFHLITRL